ncbi:hypothetical protein RCL1_006449 [Eukaryota sp. TZLM3-RCL]
MISSASPVTDFNFFQGIVDIVSKANYFQYLTPRYTSRSDLSSRFSLLYILLLFIDISCIILFGFGLVPHSRFASNSVYSLIYSIGSLVSFSLVLLLSFLVRFCVLKRRLSEVPSTLSFLWLTTFTLTISAVFLARPFPMFFIHSLPRVFLAVLTWVYSACALEIFKSCDSDV